VIFRTAQYKKWINAILKPGFSHVCIVIHKHNADILVDPRIGYTETNVYLPNSDWSILGKTVRVTRRAKIGKLRGVVGPLNCVEQAKAFLGINKWWIFTPYQLYKELKNGQHFFSSETKTI
jgi:hypothetical protein